MKIVARIFGIMFGFMIIIWGIMLTFLGDIDSVTILWMVSLNMLIASMGSIFTYGEKKDLGLADKWTLAASVISFAIGVSLVNMNFLQIFESQLLKYVFGLWLIALCVTRIGKSIFIYKLHRALNKKTSTSKRWWTILLLGIVIGLIGLSCFINPVTNFITIQVLVGIGTFIIGIDLLISQFEE